MEGEREVVDLNGIEAAGGLIPVLEKAMESEPERQLLFSIYGLQENATLLDVLKTILVTELIDIQEDRLPHTVRWVAGVDYLHALVWAWGKKAEDVRETCARLFGGYVSNEALKEHADRATLASAQQFIDHIRVQLAYDAGFRRYVQEFTGIRESGATPTTEELTRGYVTKVLETPGTELRKAVAAAMPDSDLLRQDVENWAMRLTAIPEASKALTEYATGQRDNVNEAQIGSMWRPDDRELAPIINRPVLSNMLHDYLRQRKPDRDEARKKVEDRPLLTPATLQAFRRIVSVIENNEDYSQRVALLLANMQHKGEEYKPEEVMVLLAGEALDAPKSEEDFMTAQDRTWAEWQKPLIVAVRDALRGAHVIGGRSLLQKTSQQRLRACQRKLEAMLGTQELMKPQLGDDIDAWRGRQGWFSILIDNAKLLVAQQKEQAVAQVVAPGARAVKGRTRVVRGRAPIAQLPTIDWADEVPEETTPDQKKAAPPQPTVTRPVDAARAAGQTRRKGQATKPVLPLL